MINKTKSRILLVDDTPANLDVLNNFLTDYQKSVAINGKEAIKIAQNSTNKPDLILLDIMMPEMDGYETCKKLKENPLTKDIPVIFMTALSDTSDKLKGFEIGAVDYVTKPFEPDVLLKRIETHLKIAKLQNELKKHNILLEEKVNERTAELQKANKNLIAAKEKAEAADKLKGEFLAQISHEIRTPLNALMSLSGLVVEEFSDKVDENFKGVLEGINRSGLRIIRTVELIINYAEVSGNSYEALFINVNIATLVREQIIKFKKEAADKGLELIFTNNSTKSIKKIDEHSLESIISNIVENAVIFTNEGKIVVELRNENDKLIFECTDTGIGISKDYLPIIFEPFSQESKGYTRRYEGNGLGLSLAKKYCEINNLELEIESEKGIGTKVRIIFPN